MTMPRLAPGYCQHCRVECADRLGSEIWPDRLDLAAAKVWICPLCDARVGSHEATGLPLGTAANPELRRARMMLHERLDPIWKKASDLPNYADARRNPDQGERMKALAIIRNAARKRVYRFLAAGMGISAEECHVAMFDIVDCRRAWMVLQGIRYLEVRAWAKENPEPEKEPKPKKKKPATSEG